MYDKKTIAQVRLALKSACSDDCKTALNVVEEIEIPTVHFSHKKFSVKFISNLQNRFIISNIKLSLLLAKLKLRYLVKDTNFQVILDNF